MLVNRVNEVLGRDGSEENATRRGFKSQNDSIQVKEIDKKVDIEL